MKQPHFPGISQLDLKQIDLAFSGMAIHEAMVLCHTARARLTEGRAISAEEKLIISQKLEGMLVTPSYQMQDVIERFVLPDTRISIGSFIINPLDDRAIISNRALEDLKKLSSSYIFFTAIGPRNMRMMA
jgi:hypothetical protein